MDPIIFLVLLACLVTPIGAHSSKTTSSIVVIGVVYCDVCSNNTFSTHSYFLSGAKVHVDCKFKASSASTSEEISFSVNRTTDKYGIYKLQIPSVDGVDCAEGLAVQSFCQASLIGSSSSSCSVPGLKTTSNQVAIKSTQASICFYSLNALNYRPSTRDTNLCGETKGGLGLADSFNSSKFFFPYFPPPFGFPWPPIPRLPPFSSFPFLNPSTPPSLPFPFLPLPPLPFVNPPPPSLPFPFPPLPPLPSLPPFPFMNPPPPPKFLPFPFPPLPPLPSLPPLPPIPSLFPSPPPPPPPPPPPTFLPFPFPPLPPFPSLPPLPPIPSLFPSPPPPPPPPSSPSLPFPFPPFPRFPLIPYFFPPSLPPPLSVSDQHP